MDIIVPRGRVYRSKNGKTTISIIWNPKFPKAANRRYGINGDLQKFIDTTILKGCEPYTPRATGTLIRSGIQYSEIGSGELKWGTVYAKRLYYNPQYKFRIETQTPQKRGGLWFERWLADNRGPFIAAVKAYSRRLSGGGITS